MNNPKESINQNSFILYFRYFVDIIIMVMPACGYLDTARLMVESQSPAAFNPVQCLILISAQGLKILYRIFHPYAARVFGQSVTQFTVAFLMVFLKFHYSKPQHDKMSSEKQKFPYFFYIMRTKTFIDFLLSFSLYLSFILAFFYIGYNFIDRKLAIETIGILANLIETTIVLPIFYKVVIRRDINNLSKILILQFASGDIMRLVLFILSKAPPSFIAGVCLQITLDMILFVNYLQLYFCSDKKKQEEEELIPKGQFDEVETDISLSVDENKDLNDGQRKNEEEFKIESNIY